MPSVSKKKVDIVIIDESSMIGELYGVKTQQQKVLLPTQQLWNNLISL